jgi:hypothetical protein
MTRGEAKFCRSSDVAERGFCAACGTQLMVMGFEALEPVAVQDDLPHTRIENIPISPRQGSYISIGPRSERPPFGSYLCRHMTLGTLEMVDT